MSGIYKERPGTSRRRND